MQLADADGDGHIDVLVSTPETTGYVPLTVPAGAVSRQFVRDRVAPPFAWDDPELRLIDLDGDGVTDALRTGARFELYYRDRALGWSHSEVRDRDDIDRFPDVFFSDPRVKLADMNGDGLQDIVFVTDGRVDYWPSAGYGVWGERVTIGGALSFPDALAFDGLGFDPRRLLLGDIDGDGVADLVYVQSGCTTVWVNQSGNRWGEPVIVPGTPPLTDMDAVRLADMLGAGVAGLLWTYDERAFSDSTYKFLDFTGGTKPYLLHARDNHSGARTLVGYAPSTRFLLEDERQPVTRWRGRLPFPIPVVASVEVIDEVSGGKLTSEYRYHQGYWDGVEREFRGFGIVEQFDSETIARFSAPGLHGAQSFSAVGADQFSPPLWTRTQAEDTLFDDPLFGGGGLAPDQAATLTASIGRTRSAGDAPNVVVSGWQVYDNKGRVVEQYEPFFDQGWEYQTPTETQRGRKVTLFYDGRGRLTRAQRPDGSEQRVVFGVPSDLTDPTRATPTPWETYTYDANDNAGRTHGEAAAAYRDHWNTPGSVVSDPLGRPVRLWARDDAAGAVALRQQLAYGDGGSSSQPPDERAAARASNLLGQLTSHHDEAGLIAVQAVDFKGNVLAKSRRVIADAAILAAVAPGPAGAWQAPPFQTDWQPGPLETLADREAVLLEATVYLTSATYDALNRPKGITLPRAVDGVRRRVLPHYNRAGGLEQVWLDDTSYVARIAYDAKGQRTLIVYGNGVMTRAAHDPLTFRLRRLRSERYSQPDALTFASASDPLQDEAYADDLIGNILAISDRAPASGVPNNPEALTAVDPTLAHLLVAGNALNRRFTYDPLYRLLSATGRECDLPPVDLPWLDAPRCTDLTRSRPYRERYTYDAAGNLLRLDHRNGSGGFTRQFSLGAQNNRLATMQAGPNTYAYTYDSTGNMVTEGTVRHCQWNHADQLKVFRTQTEGAEPSIYAHYLYDATGQRVKKLVRMQGGQVEVTHAIDGVFEHRRWGGPTPIGENNRLHVLDGQQRIALVRVGPAHPDDKGPAVQYQLADHLGSSTVVVDGAGALVNREEYTPYGETSFGSFARKRYRFSGKERDEESGLNYHGARYYAPWLLRWLSCDPASAVGVDNLYGYCFDNPVRFRDPSGESPDASQNVFNRLDTDGNGRLDSKEVYNGTQCMTSEATDNFLLNEAPNKFTKEGWAMRNILLEPYFARQEAQERRIAESERNQVYMWEDGSQSTKAERQRYLIQEEYYVGGEIRTGLGFGAVYYGLTGDRNGAQILNGLGAVAGGAAADASSYQNTGRAIAAQGQAPVESVTSAEVEHIGAGARGRSNSPFYTNTEFNAYRQGCVAACTALVDAIASGGLVQSASGYTGWTQKFGSDNAAMEFLTEHTGVTFGPRASRLSDPGWYLIIAKNPVGAAGNVVNHALLGRLRSDQSFGFYDPTAGKWTSGPTSFHAYPIHFEGK